MQNWRRLIGTTGLCLALVAPLPLNALGISLPTLPPRDAVALPTPIVRAELPSPIVIRGELTYTDLEGGFYTVAGYRLIADQQELEAYLGKKVVVTGQLADDISIYMTKAINVERLVPAAADELLRITGELIYEDIEGGYYAVDGYRLIGGAEKFEALLNQQVVVVGTLADEMSIYMTKAIDVISISGFAQPEENFFKSVEAFQAPPDRITVDGIAVDFGQTRLAERGILMVPLRAVAEATGGHVVWSSRTKTARVELPDRIVTFVPGTNEVEVSQPVDNIKENIAMAQAPEIIGDRLHISADALSSALGLFAMDTGGSELALVTRPEVDEPAPGFDDEIEWGTISGSIQQITAEGRTRILVEGEAMSNGEPMLIWLTVDGNTKLLWAASQDAANVTDLAVGQTIKVALSGPVLESYPAQGGASLVTILE